MFKWDIFFLKFDGYKATNHRENTEAIRNEIGLPHIATDCMFDSMHSRYI